MGILKIKNKYRALVFIALSTMVGMTAAVVFAKPLPPPVDAHVKNKTGDSVPMWYCPGPNPKDPSCVQWSTWPNGTFTKLICKVTVNFDTIGNERSKKWYLNVPGDFGSGTYVYVQSTYVVGNPKHVGNC